MPDLLVLSAIVIGGRDLGESDRLVTLFTLEAGKTRVVAKGAKRSRRRFLNALEPFTRICARVAPPRTSGLGRLDGADVLASPPDFAARFEAYPHAALCGELADLWFREGDPQPGAYRLLDDLVRALAAPGADPARLSLWFQARVLALAGYGPTWDRCPRCGRPAAGVDLPFSLEGGGPVCCRPGEDPALRVSAGTLRTLSHLAAKPMERLDRLRISPATLEEGLRLLRRLHCHHLQRMPASYRVLAEFARPPAGRPAGNDDAP
ncbi:DNA repair protein RecO [Dissulfurirhabdus thermomarina]|uniref:DNA repair protein RecO n=1 Tax=Dissulfurirhabdus thermomarina TaxID=1765737 RepID=A0A6N9TSY6_DISTH|nr:DNA repair protein RecO [Dissulfurirhabdus thermomarina]NDY42854.1 DNA repair protein RecO [Dissulfurirhabdus thermomarina]NMX23499.1 DNA repair protein RecO [Dissulfurirhabdus thermomarina]